VTFESDLLRQILRLHERLSRALEAPAFGAAEIERRGTHWEPRADVIKSPDCFMIAVELPGTPKESIRLEAEADKLILTGERPVRELAGEGRFRRMEGVFGKFKRVFPLPPGADTGRIEAALGSGLLEVKIPLGEGDTCKTRRIRIG
jgi:HSP20 family protein